MGLSNAFAGADFSGIADDEGLCISHAIQKAYIEANEEGSEAVAVTRKCINLQSYSAYI